MGSNWNGSVKFITILNKYFSQPAFPSALAFQRDLWIWDSYQLFLLVVPVVSLWNRRYNHLLLMSIKVVKNVSTYANWDLPYFAYILDLPINHFSAYSVSVLTILKTLPQILLYIFVCKNVCTTFCNGRK